MFNTVRFGIEGGHLSTERLGNNLESFTPEGMEALDFHLHG
jgi:hypothetical protein